MQKVPENLLVYGKNTQNRREVHIGPVEPRDKNFYSPGSDFVHGFMERENCKLSKLYVLHVVPAGKMYSDVWG